MSANQHGKMIVLSSRQTVESPKKKLKFLKPRWLGCDQGIAALEMAIMTPFLLVLLGAIIDFGYIFWVDLTLTNAVREGARVGATKDTETDAESEAEDYTCAYLNVLGGRFDCDQTDTTISKDLDLTNEKMTVTGTINFTKDKALIGLLPAAVFPLPLYAEAVMRWELSGTSSTGS